MAVFRTVIRSDLQKPLVVQQLSGNMFTADNASNEIAVEVTNGGEPVALSGAVTAYAVRADGVTAMFSGTISGNVASVILPASCYVEVGTLSIVIKVGTTTVGACTCYVYRTTTDEIVDPGHVIPSIDELLEQIEACRTATANANTAATNANTAASNANAKATLADEKATLADQKATLANTAAQNADTKASMAVTAATNANTKAGLANDAATLANTKATLADEKATLADTKATLANTAATNANTKAGLADTAAQNADAKATLANNAATLANTKAGLAETAATNANTAAGKIDNMTVAASGLPEGSAPIATISEVDGHKHVLFQIPKGDKGKDFRIAKTFASISAMMAYTGTDLEKYDFAMIDTGSVEDPDTGKLYCYEPEKNPKWSYIGDLSGAQGIKGETGTGIDHVTLNNDYTLTIYYDNGTQTTTTSIRGATGITPAITIGTVATLQPGQQAYVTRDPSSTAENPVFNFGIPKGDTGSAENVYGTTVPMSESDSTSVYNAIGSKLDKNQGTANAGKFMKVGANGELVPDTVPDPTNKADKVTNATTGNFAGLDATGNLTDSGKSAEDFAGAIYKTATPGSIVTIDDGADDLPIKELKVAIDPVQDLHGYDSPWPAGGGKNLLKTDGLSYAPPSDTEWENTRLRTFTPNSFCVGCSANNYYMPNQLTEYSVSENRVTVTTGGIAYGVNIPIIGLTVGETYTFSATAPEGDIQIGAWQQDGTSLGTVSTGATATTRTFTVPENAYFILICFLAKTSNVQAVFTNIQLEKGSTATSWTPFSNICPITGFDGLTVTRTGKNLLAPRFYRGVDYNKRVGQYALYGAGLVDITESITKSGNAFSQTGSSWGLSMCLVADVGQLTGKQIRVSGTFTGDLNVNNGLRSAWYFTDENYIVTRVAGTMNINPPYVLTPMEGEKYLIWYINSSASGTITLDSPMLELGSTATAYEPYQGGTYDITFPSEAGTVYGGTLDVITGVLTVDKAEVDLGTLTWIWNQDNGWIASFPYIKPMTNNNYPMDAICSTMPVVSKTNSNNIVEAGTNEDTIAATWQGTYLYGANANAHPTGMLCYALATPITYHLTPQEIRTLLGVNNIWADTGDITELIYPVNTDTAMALYEKADKVVNATAGNFASLDANGNLTDSGKKPSDFLTEHQDISGKLDKNQGSANAGKFMKVGNDGGLVPDTVPDPTNKADKVQNATNGNFAGLDANGNLTDSGKKPSDFLTEHQDISGKVDKNQGAANTGKVLGINNQGQVVPVPFSGEDFTGATPASAGTHGYVPAPQITDMTKFLCGDGTWADVAGGKLVTFELDEVTGTGGSYGHITNISSVTHDMKAVLIEVSDPDAFLDEISISCMDGGIALSCNNVNGTSTVTVSCLFKANPDNLTSSEFDVLSNRIGTLGNLKTTAKSNLVGAANELYDDIAETKEDLEQTQDGLGIGADGDTHAAIGSGQFVYVRNHDTLANGLYKANSAISANGALSTSNLTPDGSGGLNALKGDIDTLNSNITNMVVEFGTSSKVLTQNLTDNWQTAVPNDSRVYFVRINSMYGAFYGVICRYSDVYGTGVVSRYDGRVYRIQMDNGSCSSYQLQNRPIEVLSTGSKTISGNGNISYTFSNKVLVLGVYSTSSDIVCSAHPSSGADSSGSAEWWIHCRNAKSSSSVASGTITCYIIYIDMA